MIVVFLITEKKTFTRTVTLVDVFFSVILDFQKIYLNHLKGEFFQVISNIDSQ
jgi:hypothetical protein